MALTIDGVGNGLATGANSVNTNNISLTTANAGNIILATAHFEAVNAQGAPPAFTGFTDNSGAGLIWNTRKTVTMGPGGIGTSFNLLVLGWAYASTALSAFQITATTTGAITVDDSTIVVIGVTGFTGTSYITNPWDSAASTTTVGTGNTVPTLSGFATNNANTMIIGCGGSPSGTGFATPGATYIVPPNGFIGEGGGTNNSNIGFEYKILSSIQTGLTVNFNASQNGWLLIADALLADGGVAPTINTPTAWRHIIPYPLDWG